MPTIGHWIGGRAVPGTSGRVAPVHDPARGTAVAEVALASAAGIDHAVAAAVAAAADWGTTPTGRRSGGR